MVKRYLGAQSYANLQRVIGWDRAPERCACGQQASHLREGRALCAGCADPMIWRTRAALARTHAVLASVAADGQAGGIVGCALPFEQTTRYKDSFEVWHRQCFGLDAVVPLTQGHKGETLCTVRAFSLPSGLYFEGDLARAASHLRGYTGLSIEANIPACEENLTVRRSDGAVVRHIFRAELTAIALLHDERPHYRSTWCWARSPEAWQRVYGGMRTDYQRIASGY